MVDVASLANTTITNSNNLKLVDETVEGVNTILGLYTAWIQALMTVGQLVAQAYNNTPDPSTLIGLLTKNVEEILQGLEALAAETKMLTLTPIVRHAWNRLATLVMEGKYGKDVDQPIFFKDVQDAAYTFADDSFWIRPYLSSFSFEDPWFLAQGTPPIIDYAGAQFVYDPQLSLPAFVQVIGIFAVVAAIFHEDTNDAATLQPYFTDFATLLDMHYVRVTDGLLMVPIPSLSELYFDQFNFRNEGGYYTNPNWWHGYWPGEIGAVDIYSVFSKYRGSPGYPSAVFQWEGSTVAETNAGNIVEPYPGLADLLAMVSDDPFTPHHLYRWFHIRVVIGTLARFKALYIAKGYDRVWSLVQKLRFLSSGSPGTLEFNFPATPPPEATDRKAHWCLSEFDPIISQLDGTLYGNGFLYEGFVRAADGGDLPHPITAEDIISRLQAVVEYSTKAPLYEPNVPVQTPRRPLSLRATIASVAV
jgi:hypothetical protein